MYLYIWRHNRTFHSWSMINEPCVHQSVYTDAVIAVIAASVDDALTLIARDREGWIVDELRRLQPRVIGLDRAGTIFAHVCGG